MRHDFKFNEAKRVGHAEVYPPDKLQPEPIQSGRHWKIGGRLLGESCVGAAENGKVQSLLACAFRDADHRPYVHRDGVRIVVLVLPGDFVGLGAHQGAPPESAQNGTAIAIPSGRQRDVSPRSHNRWRIWAGLLIMSASFVTGIYADDASFRPVLGYLSHGAQLMPSSSPFASVTDPKSRPAMEISLGSITGSGPRESSRAGSSLPLPDSYGLYAVSNGQLTRLESMHIRIPDARIAFAGLITKPGPAKLPDGRLSFLAYQRDLATNAPDTASIRIIAQVTRALTFGTAGVPKTTLLEDTWAMRAVSFDLQVAPVPESREMMQLRFADPNFSLSPGRYMLVFNNQAYDFTVEGAVSDLAHCLERTETQNGNVYTQCRELPKPPEPNLTLRLSHRLP